MSNARSRRDLPDWRKKRISAPGGRIGAPEMLDLTLSRMLRPQTPVMIRPADARTIPQTGYAEALDYAREAYLAEHNVERDPQKMPIGPTTQVWLRYGRKAMRTIIPWQVAKRFVEATGQDVTDLVTIPLDMMISGQAEPGPDAIAVLSRFPQADWTASPALAYRKSRRALIDLIVERLDHHWDHEHGTEED